MDVETRHQVADLLDKLANGDTVALGDFGDNGDVPTPAAYQAEALRDLATDLRR